MLNILILNIDITKLIPAIAGYPGHTTNILSNR